MKPSRIKNEKINVKYQVLNKSDEHENDKKVNILYILYIDK